MRMFVQLNSDVVAMVLEAAVSGATTPSYKERERER